MKKFLILSVLSIFIGCGAVIAEDMTTFESVFYIKAKHTLPTSSSLELKKQFMNGKFESALTSFLKECKPYEENIDVDIFGINFTINIKSDGMVNDKCSYALSGKINSISESTRDEYNIYIPNSEISEIEPKIKCDFTQEQLALLIDTIADKSGDFTTGGASIKNAIYKQKSKQLSTNDEKVISMFEKGNVCSITNKEELIQQISKLDLSTIK